MTTCWEKRWGRTVARPKGLEPRVGSASLISCGGLHANHRIRGRGQLTPGSSLCAPNPPSAAGPRELRTVKIRRHCKQPSSAPPKTWRNRGQRVLRGCCCVRRPSGAACSRAALRDQFGWHLSLQFGALNQTRHGNPLSTEGEANGWKVPFCGTSAT
jgi:hypothetical protein